MKIMGQGVPWNYGKKLANGKRLGSRKRATKAQKRERGGSRSNGVCSEDRRAFKPNKKKKKRVRLLEKSFLDAFWVGGGAAQR